MPDLEFRIEGAAAVPFCATPTLGLTLRVTNRSGGRVEAVALDCQVRIEAQRRRYGPGEHGRLVELFGEPARWSDTLRSLLWAHTRVSVPPFDETVQVELHLPCTADFNVLAGKFFQGVRDGTVPITVLFSGSVFYPRGDGALQVTRVPWSAEAAYDLPASAWWDLLERYYPNTAWLTLRRDVYDRLQCHRGQRGLPTWEQVLDELLDMAELRAGEPARGASAP